MFLADRLLRFGLQALGITGALALAGACSSREESFRPDPPSTLDSDASVPDPPKKCGLRCSRDLKQVLEGCDGEEQTVVETCSADQGCGGEHCVDACTAAALNKGSTGCEFWTLPPVDAVEMPGSCFAAMVANTWDRPVSVSAGFGGEPLDISKSIYTVSRNGEEPEYTLLEGALPSGEVAIVFFSHDEGDMGKERTYCPPQVTPAMLVDPAIHGTAKSKAFQIKTDAPVSAYSIYPYGGADTHVPTATLLLPASSWEKNYLAVSPFYFGQPLKRRILQIVANDDDTEVSMRPTVEVPAGAGVAGATAGVTQTWKLGKGEVLQFVQPGMTGSPIETNKPVAVFGGSQCTFIPSTSNWCDLLQQQIPGVAQWGTEYAVVPFPSRIDSLADARERVPYTIVAAAEGTTFTYEPSRPRDAPEKLNAGESADFITDEVFVVRSQDSKHPFHVNVYMTGSAYGGGTGSTTTGDPDYVNVPAADQYLDRYVFFTDFTFPDTRLTVVRRRTAAGFLPVELECAGGPIEGFRPLGTSGEYEYAFVTLTEAFLPQKFAKGECSYGRQEARSDGPFAVTVWGVGIDASYGYVAGTGLRPVNDAPPPIIK